MRTWIIRGIVIVVVLVAVPLRAAREQKFPDGGSPHWLYLPKQIDPAKTYWVVVGVHGADWRNRGANKMAGWADSKDNVIVLAPKFGKAYQNANPDDQELLIGLFKQLQQQYRVHPTMFLYGFSGGSQFAHRFAMKQPDYVCGVSSHSGGSWGTDAYGRINEKAKHIPFAISCGEKDTGKAWEQAPYNRLVWFQRFRDAIAEQDFFYKAASWPNVGHRDSPGVWTMTEECFQLATTGMLPGSSLARKLAAVKQSAASGDFNGAARLKFELARAAVRLPADSGWHDSAEALARRKDLLKTALDTIDTSPAARRRHELYTRCVYLLKSGTKPNDDALLSFMQQCPPRYWHGREHRDQVVTACNAAAARHVAALREGKQLTPAAYRRLLVLWDGLAVREALLKEYDAVARTHFERVQAMREGTFKQRALETFIRQWQLGTVVAEARAALTRE